ncbi:hypothetical protein Tco_0454175 [Tanacetum coccineum]
MNEDYYHEQNSCYDSNSFGFDQVQPPQYTVNHPIFNSQNELLNSQNKLMEQMTTLRDLVGQVIQKKEEEKRIAEEQAAKDRSWKIPICYDDDEDNTIAITPVLPIEEPDNSLSMGDEHLDTIPRLQNSDEVIKLVLRTLAPIPSGSEGIPDVRTNTLIILLPNLNNFLLLIEENSSGKYHYRYDYSLPNYEAFYSDDDHIKEKSSGSTTTHADFSQYDSFIFDLSINPFPPADRSDFYHEEFVDELAHIISLLEYDCLLEPKISLSLHYDEQENKMRRNVEEI